MITNQDRPLKGLARAIRNGLATTLADPNFFLDPSQFPLRLDQIYKRFYLRLDKETWDWEGVRRAREEILGPRQDNLFEQIGRALGPRAQSGDAGEDLEGEPDDVSENIEEPAVALTADSRRS